jgi:pimeloyl-ACP methyl ester carboxylesterase
MRDKIEFQTPREDGDLTLVGNYWEADSDAGIVMAHGFTGDKSEWDYFDRIAESLNDAGYNVLAFDFAGSGESDDEALRVGNQVNDLGTAINYMLSEGLDRIGLYGHSQGGLVSLRNYSDIVEAMVLTSPVTDSLADYANTRLTEEQREELEENGFYTKIREKGVREEYIVSKEVIRQKENLNQDELLQGVKCPVKIIHGENDEVVPIESSRKAAAKLQNGEIVEIKGLDHGYDEKLDEVEENAVEFFSKTMPISET